MDDRYTRTGPQHDYYGRRETQDYGRDYGSGRDYGYSSARTYAAAGEGEFRGDPGLGRESYGGGRGDYGRGGYGRDHGRAYQSGYGAREGSRHAGYGSNRDRMYRDDEDRGDWGRQRSYGRDRDRDPDYEDRGFLARAGDEVRSWFGDEEAERRREMDQRYDETHMGSRWDSPYGHDRDYHQWRRQRIGELDRDYDEYRRENAQRFHNEFSNFRTERQTQRECLDRVTEHMEVVGSDGQHVGTVDKVRGDRIMLTKSDQDAGGHHHSIPSRWIDAVDDKVTIRKTADEAKAQWRDEERSGALFGGNRDEARDHQSWRGDHNLNRSFSGTY